MPAVQGAEGAAALDDAALSARKAGPLETREAWRKGFGGRCRRPAGARAAAHVKGSRIGCEAHRAPAQRERQSVKASSPHTTPGIMP